jgi:DnaK suppressor protein
MTASHLSSYRDLLLEKRNELTRTLATGDGPGRGASERFPDAVDQSVHAFEADVRIRLRQTDSRLLRAIDAALDRIDHDAFGICEMCVQPIPPARLKVVPWARLCRDCKEQQDAEGTGRDHQGRGALQQASRPQPR